MSSPINKNYYAGSLRAELLELGFDSNQASIKFAENWLKKGTSIKTVALMIAEIELFKLKYIDYLVSEGFGERYYLGLHSIEVLHIAKLWFENGQISLSVFNHYLEVFQDLVQLEKEDFMARHEGIDGLVNLDIPLAKSCLDYSQQGFFFKH